MKLGAPLLLLAAVAICIVAALNGFQSAPFQSDIASAATKLVGGLFVITVFVERSTAVLNTIWFGEPLRVAQARLDLEQESFARSRLPDAAISPALTTAATAVARDRSPRRQAPAYASFVIGLLVSAAGVRTLDNLVILPTAVSSVQAGWFHAIDIVITAGLIAGGSNGIAAIADLLSKFFHATQQRLATSAATLRRSPTP